MTEELRPETGRRGFMGAVGSLAAVSVLGSPKATALGTARRRLGALEKAHMLENAGAAAVRFAPPELNASVAAIKIEGARLPESSLAPGRTRSSGAGRCTRRPGSRRSRTSSKARRESTCTTGRSS
jgi:hypothetical protein